QLEDILKKMLATEKLKPSLTEVPLLEGLEGLKAMQALEDLGIRSTPLNTPSEEEDGACAQEVYIQYGSGARNCSQEWMNTLDRIRSNYLRRSFEAEERFESRNMQITEFSLEKLPLVVSEFRRVLTLIRENSTKEEVNDIR